MRVSYTLFCGTWNFLFLEAKRERERERALVQTFEYSTVPNAAPKDFYFHLLQLRDIINNCTLREDFVPSRWQPLKVALRYPLESTTRLKLKREKTVGGTDATRYTTISRLGVTSSRVVDVTERCRHFANLHASRSR